MADEFDVATALVGIVSATVYPNGTGAASIADAPVIVYPGWPNAQTLDTDLADGKVHVSVYPQKGDTTSSVMMGDDGWDELSNDGTDGMIGREVMRVAKLFQVTVWAPTPAIRSAIGKALQVALSLATRIALPSTETVMLTYTRTSDDDEQQKVLLYRRDLFFTADYPITQTEAAFAILNTVTNVTGGAPGASGPTVSLTSPRT